MKRIAMKQIQGFACFFVLALLFAMPHTLCAQIMSAPRVAAEEKTESKLSGGELDVFIKTLESPEDRAAFLANLKAMQAATAKKDIEPPSLKALDAVSKFAAGAEKNFSTIINNFADLPKVSKWFTRQFETEDARLIWINIAILIVASLMAAFVANFILKALLSRLRRMLINLPQQNVFKKIMIFVGYNLVSLLPVVAFTVTALLISSTIGMSEAIVRTGSIILYGFIAFHIVDWFLRMVFSARHQNLRLLPLDNESAAYLFVWSQRLSAMVIFGYFLTRAALNMDMPDGAVHALTAIIGLVITLMVIIMILQNRTNVSAWLRDVPASGEDKTPNFWAGLRIKLADIWHVLAVAYLCVGYVVAVLNIQNGFNLLLRSTLFTLLTLIAFRFFVSAIDRLIARGFALPKDLKEDFPLLEERTNLYLPVLKRVLKGIVLIIGMFVLLSAWGVDTVAWFATPVGKKITVSGVTILLASFVGIVLWELITSFTERMMRARSLAGKTVLRSARMLTLMPLLRHTLYIVLVIAVGLFILSELGFDITPLLAGAGIIGLAIGFGAQTLVKDFITGLFILLEDSVAVGDVIEAGIHKGQVEQISIRTLRLRDVDGCVHSIPFSEVTSFVNYSKGFSFAPIEVGVGYDADLRKVMQIMRDVCEDMRGDQEFSHRIREPMEIMGVERFDASSIAVRGRIKTKPLEQWAVRREFLLRLKDALDKEKIGIPFPITTVYLAKE